MDTVIWKVMVDGIHHSPLSTSKLIDLDYEGSMAPRAASKYFCYVGHVLRTSREDMVVGDLDKSWTML